MRLVLRDVEVRGQQLDVAVEDGRVVEMGRPGRGDEEIDGAGGALLPGLHDHHVHLLAMSAVLASVDCSPSVNADEGALTAALRRSAHEDGWVRGVGYHESVAGDLDRHRIDAMEGTRPVRIQHRSGALWMLNTVALQRVQHVLDASTDVERNADGEPTGRLWRYDDRLGPALPRRQPELAAVGARLRDLGFTSVTDATPGLTAGSANLLGRAVGNGTLDLDVTVMGTRGRPRRGLRRGPLKVLLPDHDLPSWDDLVAMTRMARDEERAVAVHCVTVESLLLSLAVLEEVGPHPDDRIEHASLVPEECLEILRNARVTVVTQPDFLRTRGEQYLRSVDDDDLGVLYRFRGLLDAGVPTVASSDAPYGEVDPWRVIRTATTRETDAGNVIGQGERVSPATALAGYLAHPDHPGGPARTVEVGRVADLCLLRAPLEAALRDPDARWVRGTFRRGVPRLVE